MKSLASASSGPPVSREFADTVALVTGASSGIGRAIALAFARAGATLCAVARNESKLQETVDAAHAWSSAFYRNVDLTHNDTAGALKVWLEDQFGSLDILVHSAGCIREATMQTADIRDLDLQYENNVRAPYHLTQTLLPLLKYSRGQIVFINSSAGLVANRANIGQYAAMKHGLKAVADSLREEVNQDGVRVLSVYPGRTATPLQESIQKGAEAPYYPNLLLQPDDVADIVLAALKLPKSAEVTDIRIRPMHKLPAGVRA